MHVAPRALATKTIVSTPVERFGLIDPDAQRRLISAFECVLEESTPSNRNWSRGFAVETGKLAGLSEADVRFFVGEDE